MLGLTTQLVAQENSLWLLSTKLLSHAHAFLQQPVPGSAT
jgi:hypothetical protein